MPRRFRWLTVLPLAVLLSGCVVAIGNGDDDDWDDGWSKRQRENREAIADLELGLRRDTVIDRLGTPDFSESFLREGREFVVLFYRTHRRHGDGETSRDETTPLVFVNDDLVGWGESAIAHATAN
ncbi:MAG: DUF3192 domain-containing protein [Pseudomonadales bacterium]|jgi:hypothetical protein|nr:DUF3192 domain-containing protein [Pseudomonadales bacterium]